MEHSLPRNLTFTHVCLVIRGGILFQVHQFRSTGVAFNIRHRVGTGAKGMTDVNLHHNILASVLAECIPRNSAFQRCEFTRVIVVTGKHPRISDFFSNIVEKFCCVEPRLLRTLIRRGESRHNQIRVAEFLVERNRFGEFITEKGIYPCMRSGNFQSEVIAHPA